LVIEPVAEKLPGALPAAVAIAVNRTAAAIGASRSAPTRPRFAPEAVLLLATRRTYSHHPLMVKCLDNGVEITS